MDMREPELTHIDSQGRLKMVDVSEKDSTYREAKAEAFVVVAKETLQRITEGSIPKGNVFEASRLGGIMAAKRTWELIPLCHQLQLTGVDIEFSVDPERNTIKISTVARTKDRTGVEMEALVAATSAALTIYDMCKAIDRGIEIVNVRLTHKSGGKSGVYERG